MELFPIERHPHFRTGHRSVIDAPQSIYEGKAEKNWFKLSDDESGSTIWTFKFPENFDYEVDQPLFHTFQEKVNTLKFTSEASAEIVDIV